MYKNILIYILGIATSCILIVAFYAYVPITEPIYDVTLQPRLNLKEIEKSKLDYSQSRAKIHDNTPTGNVYDLKNKNYKIIFKKHLRYHTPHFFITALSSENQHLTIKHKFIKAEFCTYLNSTYNESGDEYNELGDYYISWENCLSEVNEENTSINQKISFTLLENDKIIGEELFVFNVIQNGYISYPRFP